MKIKKTYLEWYELHLKPKTLKKAISNFDNQNEECMKEYKFGSFKQSLNGGFVFRNTPEGFEFWIKIEISNGDIEKEEKEVVRTKHGQLEDDGAYAD